MTIFLFDVQLAQNESEISDPRPGAPAFMFKNAGDVLIEVAK
jgi:hypothetical protein